MFQFCWFLARMKLKQVLCVTEKMQLSRGCFSFFLCGYSQIICSTVFMKFLKLTPRALPDLFCFVDSWLLIFVEDGGWGLLFHHLCDIIKWDPHSSEFTSGSPFIFKEISEISHQVISIFKDFITTMSSAWTSSFREYNSFVSIFLKKYF